MSLRRFAAVRALALAALAVFPLASCKNNDSTAPVAVPVLTTVNVTLPSSTLALGQTTPATVAMLDQNGAPITAGAVTWSTGSIAIATVGATGIVTAVGPGSTQITATVGARSGTQTVTVAASPVKINEVESNGGTPGDWIELYNPTAAAVDISGWGVRDNDSTHTIYKIPAGTTIAAGGYYVVEEAQFGFGLGAPDEARLYNQFGALVELYGWATHATTTYGRCPNGGGEFATTGASTKGAANTCTAPPPPAVPNLPAFPGSPDFTTVDGTSVFGSNLSGLSYEPATATSPAVLWAVRNGPGTLYRLIFNGTIWTPDPANGWGAGKALHFTDDTGDTDSEGVTFAAGGSAAGIFVSIERNNSNNTVSRPSVLRFDPAQPGTTLKATNDWNLTADLPAVGANLGLEAITWIPDSALVARGFYDELAAHTYNPAEYPNHGTGLFFVGLEGNGNIYAYALNQVTNGFQRLATFSSGNNTVMELAYDRETGYLWAVCDDTCLGVIGILEINTTAGSPTKGRFMAPRQFNRPLNMPNLNNEGFTLAPQAECVAGRKPVFWSDDSETGGHSIRRGLISVWSDCSVGRGAARDRGTPSMR